MQEGEVQMRLREETRGLFGGSLVGLRMRLSWIARPASETRASAATIDFLAGSTRAHEHD